MAKGYVICIECIIVSVCLTASRVSPTTHFLPGYGCNINNTHAFFLQIALFQTKILTLSIVAHQKTVIQTSIMVYSILQHRNLLIFFRVGQLDKICCVIFVRACYMRVDHSRPGSGGGHLLHQCQGHIPSYGPTSGKDKVAFCSILLE